MDFRSTSVALVLLVGAGCQSAEAQTVTARDGGKFSVELGQIERQSLPRNSDLKMVDGDITKYGRKLCQLDDEYVSSPKRCDVFAQADPEGALIGYVVLRETEDGVQIETQISTNSSRGTPSRGCWISGLIFQSGSGYETPIRNAGRPFEGQMMYSAWERSPGDFLVSPVDATSTGHDPNAAIGVWYLRRTATKLRIEQERWNYCYNDVAVDEVFEPVVSFVRAGD